MDVDRCFSLFLLCAWVQACTVDHPTQEQWLVCNQDSDCEEAALLSGSFSSSESPWRCSGFRELHWTVNENSAHYGFCAPSCDFEDDIALCDGASTDANGIATVCLRAAWELGENRNASRHGREFRCCPLDTSGSDADVCPDGFECIRYRATPLANMTESGTSDFGVCMPARYCNADSDCPDSWRCPELSGLSSIFDMSTSYAVSFDRRFCLPEPRSNLVDPACAPELVGNACYLPCDNQFCPPGMACHQLGNDDNGWACLEGLWGLNCESQQDCLMGDCIDLISDQLPETCDPTQYRACRACALATDESTSPPNNLVIQQGFNDTGSNLLLSFDGITNRFGIPNTAQPYEVRYVQSQGRTYAIAINELTPDAQAPPTITSAALLDSCPESTGFSNLLVSINRSVLYPSFSNYGTRFLGQFRLLSPDLQPAIETAPWRSLNVEDLDSDAVPDALRRFLLVFESSSLRVNFAGCLEDFENFRLYPATEEVLPTFNGTIRLTRSRRTPRPSEAIAVNTIDTIQPTLVSARAIDIADFNRECSADITPLLEPNGCAPGTTHLLQTTWSTPVTPNLATYQEPWGWTNFNAGETLRYFLPDRVITPRTSAHAPNTIYLCLQANQNVTRLPIGFSIHQGVASSRGVSPAQWEALLTPHMWPSFPGEYSCSQLLDGWENELE